MSKKKIRRYSFTCNFCGKLHNGNKEPDECDCGESDFRARGV